MKDPAMLLYTADFLIGTMLMSFEEKGKYITLLCMQQQKGHLSEEEIVKIIGDFPPAIKDKFIVDDNGKYYNERAEIEIIKRKKYSESRQKNRTYENHMLMI